MYDRTRKSTRPLQSRSRKSQVIDWYVKDWMFTSYHTFVVDYSVSKSRSCKSSTSTTLKLKKKLDADRADEEHVIIISYRTQVLNRDFVSNLSSLILKMTNLIVQLRVIVSWHIDVTTWSMIDRDDTSMCASVTYLIIEASLIKLMTQNDVTLLFVIASN